VTQSAIPNLYNVMDLTNQVQTMSSHNKNNFFRLLKMGLAPRKGLFILALCSVIVFNVLELAFPKMLQVFIDAVKGNALSLFSLPLDFINDYKNGIFLIPLCLLVFAFLRWYFSYLRTVLQTRLGQKALFDLRNTIYNTMQNLSYAYHDHNHSGTLISNVVEDVGYASRFFEFGIFPLIEAPIYVLIVYVVMFTVNWPSALLSLSLLMLGSVYLYFYFSSDSKIFARTKQLYAKVVQIFTENIEGHLVIRSFGKQKQQIEDYNRNVDTLHASVFRETVATSTVSQSMIYAVIFGIFVVMGAAIFMMQRHGAAFTDGQLFLLYYLQASLIPRIRMMARSFDLVMRMKITADRLAPLFMSQEYLPDNGTDELTENNPGLLEVKDLSFAYGNKHHSLQNISLTIEPGQTIGIVGTSGAGKSTLALLLCRFYDPQEGTVLLDGKDIRTYSVKAVRDQFALVFQDTFLFSASLRENIAYGFPGARFEDIVDAASRAKIHDFIMSLPEQYDTKIGERGVTLSGGQRQRISIARALLRKPRFLILDDCTSALDTNTEKAIQESVQELHRHSTIIIIAHRFSSIAGADSVFVLDGGRVVEQGRPEDLHHRGSHFSRILQSYHGGVQ